MLILGQIGPDGIAAPPGCGFSILDSLLGTFVDTAQALEALRRPYGLAVSKGNGGCRTIPSALAAPITAIPGEERLCASGKFVEPKVGEMGLQSGQAALMDTVYLLLSLNLLGHSLQFLSGGGNLLNDFALVIGIGADNVVVGHL